MSKLTARVRDAQCRQAQYAGGEARAAAGREAKKGAPGCNPPSRCSAPSGTIGVGPKKNIGEFKISKITN